MSLFISISYYKTNVNQILYNGRNTKERVTPMPLTSEQLTKIKHYTEHLLAADTSGHDMAHINRVVNLAKYIQYREGGDLDIILASAYLHDLIDDKIFPNPELAKYDLQQFLMEIKIESEQQELIFRIIERMSFSHQLDHAPKLSLEAKIVQDADRLDAIGAIGVARTFYYGGHKGHIMHQPDIAPRQNLTKDDYRKGSSVINHFYEKLFKIKSTMQTQTGFELAEERTKFMEQFVNEFLREWNFNELE